MIILYATKSRQLVVVYIFQLAERPVHLPLFKPESTLHRLLYKLVKMSSNESVKSLHRKTFIYLLKQNVQNKLRYKLHSKRLIGAKNIHPCACFEHKL